MTREFDENLMIRWLFVPLLQHSPHAQAGTFDFRERNPGKLLDSLNVRMCSRKPLEIRETH